MLQNIVHCFCSIALFLRFIALIMPCGIVHITQYCTLLMFHCIVFTLCSAYYALWLCSCYATLHVRLMAFVAMVLYRSTFFRAYCFLVYHFVLFVFFTNSITDVAGGFQGLTSLADLVPDILAVSRAPLTVKGFHAQFIKWKARAANFPDVVSFPATDLHFSLYLISLLQAGYSFSTISSAFYGVNFFHSSCGVCNPCDSGFVKAVLEGCKRCYASSISTRKKLPICPC